MPDWPNKLDLFSTTLFIQFSFPQFSIVSIYKSNISISIPLFVGRKIKLNPSDFSQN